MIHTFLSRRENVQRVQSEQHQRRRELVSEKPELSSLVSISSRQAVSGAAGGCAYVNSVVLVELGNLLDLAHHDDHGRGTAEQPILGSEVVLPGRHKVRDALLEELAVNFDLRHRD